MMKIVSWLLAGCTVSVAQAQTSTPAAEPQVLAALPQQNKGVTNAAFPTIDLANEVGLSGLVLRARAVTIAPGGYTAAHVHMGRPTQECVAQGTAVEVRNGVPIVHSAGETVQGGQWCTSLVGEPRQ